MILKQGVKQRDRTRAILAFVTFAALSAAPAAPGQNTWPGFAKDAQHTALSGVQSQPLSQIVWQTPVDLQPHFDGGDLHIHYGSPVITSANTVIVPVKTGATEGFELQARSGIDGSLKWTATSDYTLPPHSWTPGYGPTVTPQGRVYFAGAGGSLYYRANLDAVGDVIADQVVFYGAGKYSKNKGKYNSTVQINTPLTSGSDGTIYFGYKVTGKPPNKLKSGLARVDINGKGTFVPIATASNGKATKIVTNCAPALSNDGRTVYFAANDGKAACIVALDSSSLATIRATKLIDPASGSVAQLSDDGSASATIGPDGRVFLGVLDNPRTTARGWLMQFNANLTSSSDLKPGAFGWDDTASIVPSPNVPSYHGTSPYLVMVKYNDYVDAGGTGINRIAILDPNASQTDARTGVTVMLEVLTIAGPTHDEEYPSRPNAVREWCINTAVIDPFTHSVLANSEDGKLYRWDLTTNSFTEVVTLTAGVGEAYTPTLIGSDGKVYAINNSTLFAVGAAPAP